MTINGKAHISNLIIKSYHGAIPFSGTGEYLIPISGFSYIIALSVTTANNGDSRDTEKIAYRPNKSSLSQICLSVYGSNGGATGYQVTIIGV